MILKRGGKTLGIIIIILLSRSRPPNISRGNRKTCRALKLIVENCATTTTIILLCLRLALVDHTGTDRRRRNEQKNSHLYYNDRDFNFFNRKTIVLPKSITAADPERFRNDLIHKRLRLFANFFDTYI